MKNILGTILLTMIAAGFGFSQCSDADKKTLAAWDASWTKANQSGDRGAMMKIYADDFAGLPGMQTKTSAIDGAMATYERNKANPSGADRVTADHYFISCTPMTATITHRNTIVVPDGPDGKPETFYSRSVHFLEKRGGAWQVVSNAGSDLDDYAVLWYLEQDWNDAIKNRDKAWFESNFAPDFQSVSSTTAERMNKAAEIADTVGGKSTVELAETTGMNIRLDRDFAVVTGTFRTKGKDEKGAAYDRSTRYTDTWIRRNGKWYAWGTSGTVIPTSSR